MTAIVIPIQLKTLSKPKHLDPNCSGGPLFKTLNTGYNQRKWCKPCTGYKLDNRSKEEKSTVEGQSNGFPVWTQ